VSIVTAVRKGGVVCIAADTLSKHGTTKVRAHHKCNHSKLHKVGRSVLGFTGWEAIERIVIHLAQSRPEFRSLDSCEAIFDVLLKIHKVLRDEYFVNPQEKEDQPVESSQLNGIVVNRHGLFEIDSYREVNEYQDFWAIGSGQDFALGAMSTIYRERKRSAKAIAEAGVRAACEYDDGCDLPLESRTIRLAT
jgi:ATP-dependent protease HslVU (ClpYQ) peptidase subunit